MKIATITEAKNGLSALIDQVKAGQSVVITERGIPVARIEPITSAPDQTGRLERLERAGIVKRPSAPPPLDLLRKPGPRLRDGASVVETVIEERRTGW